MMSKIHKIDINKEVQYFEKGGFEDATLTVGVWDTSNFGPYCPCVFLVEGLWSSNGLQQIPYIGEWSQVWPLSKKREGWSQDKITHRIFGSGSTHNGHGTSPDITLDIAGLVWPGFPD